MHHEQTPLSKTIKSGKDRTLYTWSVACQIKLQWNEFLRRFRSLCLSPSCEGLVTYHPCQLRTESLWLFSALYSLGTPQVVCSEQQLSCGSWWNNSLHSSHFHIQRRWMHCSSACGGSLCRLFAGRTKKMTPEHVELFWGCGDRIPQQKLSLPSVLFLVREPIPACNSRPSSGTCLWHLHDPPDTQQPGAWPSSLRAQFFVWYWSFENHWSPCHLPKIWCWDA